MVHASPTNRMRVTAAVTCFTFLVLVSGCSVRKTPVSTDPGTVVPGLAAGDRVSVVLVDESSFEATFVDESHGILEFEDLEWTRRPGDTDAVGLEVERGSACSIHDVAGIYRIEDSRILAVLGWVSLLALLAAFIAIGHGESGN